MAIDTMSEAACVQTGERFIVDQRQLELAGPPVATLACQFDLQWYADHLPGQYRIDLPQGAARWVRKRRAEYLAGRIAAQGAFALLQAGPHSVPMGADRAPCWPDAMVGSITHSGRQAVCSVARRDRVHALGIDLEAMIAPHTAREIIGSIVSDVEIAALRALPMPLEHALTIAFSAKESLYKALYPDVRAFFDFDAAELCALDPAAQTFVLRLTRALSPRWAGGTCVSGRYLLEPDTVLTHIAVMRQDVPLASAASARPTRSAGST